VNSKKSDPTGMVTANANGDESEQNVFNQVLDYMKTFGEMRIDRISKVGRKQRYTILSSSREELFRVELNAPLIILPKSEKGRSVKIWVDIKITNLATKEYLVFEVKSQEAKTNAYERAGFREGPKWEKIIKKYNPGLRSKVIFIFTGKGLCTYPNKEIISMRFEEEEGKTENFYFDDKGDEALQEKIKEFIAPLIA
jgi:hypothetical protein